MDAATSPTRGSDSASPSGGESDADAHPRVHPAQQHEPASRHGFACAFARGRCGHDELFRPHYTRTNLRKGDKILRCFPHCCPDHVTRSFCGASLHVDVCWTAPDGAAPSDPETLVFARFRVQDVRGRVPGDHVTLAEISQSLQSESNPHGEWIAAASVSSASAASGSHEWVFELNHEARWYYHWESGVAKRHRLKHHVLDVYVLSPSFSATSAASVSAGDRRPLEVVAVTRSPPFRLISFRRATPKAVQALSVPRVQRASSGSAKSDASATASASGDHSRRPSATTTHATRRPREAKAEQDEDDEAEEKTSQAVETLSLARPPMRRPRVGEYPPPAQPHHQTHAQHHAYAPTTIPSAWSSHETTFPQHRAPPPASAVGRPSFADLTSFLHRQPPPPQTVPPAPTLSVSPLALRRGAATASQRLLRLLRSLRVLRSADTVQYMDTFQRVYDEALARAGVYDQPRPHTTPVDAVYHLLADAGVLHAPRRTRAPLPAEVTAILCELLLWLSFDVDLHRAVHAIVARDAAAVFSQPRLQTVFAGLVAWLERHVDAFLGDRGWRLEDIVRAADEGVAAPHQDDEFATALRICVAQFSEHCAAQAKASARRRRPLRPSTGVSVARPLGRGPSQWALNGDWKCEMLRGGISVRALGSLSSLAPEDLSLPTLFAMVRELGAISVRLDGKSQASTALHVCSLLNPSASSGEPEGTRLTLDQTGHWFRSLPSGVSTAALALGDLQWGDHAGEAAWASEAVQCRLYAWGLPRGSSLASLGRCFQLQLWTPTADSLVVRVVGSRAVLDPAEASRLLGVHAPLDAVAERLPFCSLDRKLRLVRAWEPTLEAELQYGRVRRR